MRKTMSHKGGAPARFRFRKSAARGLCALGFVLAVGFTNRAAAEPVSVSSGVISLGSEGGLAYTFMGPGFQATKDSALFHWDETALDIGCFNEGGCGNQEVAGFTTGTFENAPLGSGSATVGGTSVLEHRFSRKLAADVTRRASAGRPRGYGAADRAVFVPGHAHRVPRRPGPVRGVPCWIGAGAGIHRTHRARGMATRRGGGDSVRAQRRRHRAGADYVAADWFGTGWADTPAAWLPA